jgi:hypothetical protein
MEYRNIAFSDKNRELSKNEENGSELNPSTDSSGNPSAPPTHVSTENRFFQKTGGAVFHTESETAENQSQSGLQTTEEWNIAKFKKKDETAENQSQSGLQATEKWNIAQNSYIPQTSLLDGIETKKFETHWCAIKGDTVGVGSTENDAREHLMSKMRSHNS